MNMNGSNDKTYIQNFIKNIVNDELSDARESLVNIVNEKLKNRIREVATENLKGE